MDTAMPLNTWMLGFCFIISYLLGSALTATISDKKNLQLNPTSGDFEIVYPRVHRMSRKKRSIADNTLSDNEHNDLVVVVKGDNQTFYMELRPAIGLTSENIAHDVKHATGVFESSKSHQDVDPCLYRGKVISGGGGQAAISICNGDKQLSGIVITPDATYTIEPHIGSSVPNVQENAHVLTKTKKYDSAFCGVKTIEEDLIESVDGEVKTRRKRSTSGLKIIETAVFTDSALYDTYVEKYKGEAVKQITDLVMAIINQVQLVYNYESMKMKFKIVLVKLQILKSSEDSPDKCNGNIDEYLDTFCNWQAQKDPVEGQEGHWDHAIMLTGLDLFKDYEGRKEDKVLGLAWVNGMCRVNYSCTINEGKNFESAYVIAHELAHSLGVLHDGTSNPCDSDTFIMSDKTGPGKISWSSCTNKYMEKYFNRGQAKCLDDDAIPETSLDYQKAELLPGEKYSPLQQCQLAMGTRYKPYITKENPFDNICRELWCYTGTWATPAHPALEGSSCKKGMCCKQGDCVEDGKALQTENEKPTPASGSEGSIRSEEDDPNKKKGFFDSVTGFFKEVFHKVKGFFKTLG